MQRGLWKTTSVALAGALALGGCASSKTKPDEQAKEQTADKEKADEGKEEKKEQESIEVKPVAMADEAPEAEKLATKTA